MKVPFLDLKSQFKSIQMDVRPAIEEVLESTQFILGPQVLNLEKQIAHRLGCRYAVGVSSGTDALLIALMALGVGQGDLVLTTSYSFFATAGAIVRLGAKPVFLDIDPMTCNIDPKSLLQYLNDSVKKAQKVKAIVPVHLYGQCADMDPILEIANHHGIPVVEDAAQAFGASYPSSKGQRAAGCMGLIGCYSFFPGKNLGGFGDGGMVVTDDKVLHERLLTLRVHGAKPKYHHALIGGNFRLDTIQAAVLQVKLKYLEEWNSARQGKAKYYDEHILAEEITKPYIAYRRENHSYNYYVLSVRNRRDELKTSLDECNIGNAIYYPLPLHLQECFRDLGYHQGDLPHSEFAANHNIAIPLYPTLTSEMQDLVIDKLSQFYSSSVDYV